MITILHAAKCQAKTIIARDQFGRQARDYAADTEDGVGQTITDHRGRHAGSLQWTAGGWIARNPAGNQIGVFELADRAASKLCILASRQST
jgi:hypothetical protein